MDLSPFDASHPFLRNQADQPVTSGVMICQTGGPHFYPSKRSKSTDQTKRRSRGFTLSDNERRKRKRLSYSKYLEQAKRRLKILNTDGIYLKMEYDRLTYEFEQIIEELKLLQSNAPLPAQDLKRLESNFLQSTCQQCDNQSVLFQDHHDKDCGAVDWFNGFQMNHDVQDLQKIVSVDEEEYLTKNKENSSAGSCYDSKGITELLIKIDADDKSNVNFSDFAGIIYGELVTVGNYSFPLSLHPIVLRINDAYGDISATSKMNVSVAGRIYILFIATIKEMHDLQLEQLTEKKILKWRDAIKDALRIGFHVEFAMDHLKKIAHAFIGLLFHQQLEWMTIRISKLKAERAELLEQSSLYMDFVKEFSCKSVSTGLFP